MDELEGPPTLKIFIPSFASSPEPCAILVTTSFITKYLKDNLLYIFETGQKVKILAAPIRPPKSPWKNPLEARFPNIYCKKTYIKCYNFCQ